MSVTNIPPLPKSDPDPRMDALLRKYWKNREPMKTIKVNGEYYQYELQSCEDSDDFAVMLDLGNGKPERIGYTSNEDDARRMITDKIRLLQRYAFYHKPTGGRGPFAP